MVSLIGQVELGWLLGLGDCSMLIIVSSVDIVVAAAILAVVVDGSAGVDSVGIGAAVGLVSFPIVPVVFVGVATWIEVFFCVVVG